MSGRRSMTRAGEVRACRQWSESLQVLLRYLVLMVQVSNFGHGINLHRADSDAAHMAEELQDAAYTLPRTIVAATVINGFLMFVMAITICYVVGDLEQGRHRNVVKLTWSDFGAQSFQHRRDTHSSRSFTTPPNRLQPPTL